MKRCLLAAALTLLLAGSAAGQQVPDLEVGTPTVSDAGPEPGGSLTLSVEVSNTGAGESAATTLRYYRSTDATVTTSDTEVATVAVEALAASASLRAALTLTAPSAPGTYYYGACVDAVADESDTANNCSTSARVDVSAPQVPDLEVGTPTVSDAGPEPGGSLTLSVEVSNTGAGESAATTLRYYRSTDATVTTSDTEVATVTVEALAASASLRAALTLTAPSTPGTYYYGACVDAVADESDTTNNCSTSARVDVSAPQMPDLEVGTPTVSDAGPEPGGSLTLSATVSNTGAGESAATTLRYYRSTDATVTTSDTEVGTVAVEALAASASLRAALTLTAPSAPGTYYYGACVDAVADESDTANNCSTSARVDVSAPQVPDLEVGTPTVSDAGPEPGGSLTLSVEVSNTGAGESAATTLRYYRSTDATVTTSDTEVATVAVEALAASASLRAALTLTAPSAPGTYYYGACVDAVADESDTANNCSTSARVDVPQPVPALPLFAQLLLALGLAAAGARLAMTRSPAITASSRAGS